MFMIANASVVARNSRRDLHIFNTESEDAHFTIRCVDDGMKKIGLRAFCFGQKKCPDKNVQVESGPLAYDPIDVSPRSSVCIDGYRQHYKYIADYRDWILNDVFAIPLRRTHTLREFGLPSLAEKIAIHVRRGDYARHHHLYSFLPLASDRYYVEALIKMVEKTGLTEAVMFCEEESRADVQATLWPLLKQAVPYVDIQFAPLIGTVGKKHSPWHELLWISTASGFVVANSSFGWWSAWMSPTPADKKVVIFPKEWTGLAWNAAIREMTPPSGEFGLWMSLSNRKPSLDPIICSQGSVFAARICSVAETYMLGHYDESSDGLLDRDFTFRKAKDSLFHRNVCPLSFCIIDMTDEPWTSDVGFEVFTSLHQFLQSRESAKQWVVIRKSACITIEHVFNDLWYIMQPKRFKIDVNPAQNYRYVLRVAPYNKDMYIVCGESLRTAQVPSTEWWEARALQYCDN
jgi:hypothetical protein